MACGMVKLQSMRMECQSLKGMVLTKIFIYFTLAITYVTDYGVGQMLEMHPNLMHTTSQRPGLDKRNGSPLAISRSVR